MKRLILTKFDSTDLLLLAHDEWKRREERKHRHDMRAREMLDKLQERS